MLHLIYQDVYVSNVYVPKKFSIIRILTSYICPSNEICYFLSVNHFLLDIA